MLSKALLFLCLTFIPVILASPPYNTINGRRTAPTFPEIPSSYNINLNLNFEQQHQQVVQDFSEPLLDFINGLGIFNHVPSEILALLSYPVMSRYNQEFADEVKAISSLLNVSFAEVAALNLIYDITAQCTSIVVQDANNNVYHSRNLDFPFAPQLTKLIFHGRYFQNGTLSYEAISLAGYTGVITAVKPNGYSFSIDQYVLRNNATIWDNLAIVVLDIFQAVKGDLSPPLVGRFGFRNIDNFDDFVGYLQTTQTLSRVFYIVAGAQQQQGVVITKERRSVENATNLDIANGKWYNAQTNYIGNKPDPLDDNRLTAAKDFLNAIGRQAITKDLLLNQVMSVYPVFNNETIHTTLMQPSTGYINTTLWGWGNDADAFDFVSF